jgi:hypothetical protein
MAQFLNELLVKKYTVKLEEVAVDEEKKCLLRDRKDAYIWRHKTPKVI